MHAAVQRVTLFPSRRTCKSRLVVAAPAAPHELFWLSCWQDLAPGSQSSCLLVQLRSATVWEQDRVGPAVVLPEVAGFGAHFPTCQATCGRKLPGLLRSRPQGRAGGPARSGVLRQWAEVHTQSSGKASVEHSKDPLRAQRF